MTLEPKLCECIDVVPGPDGGGHEIPCKRFATVVSGSFYACAECASQYAPDETVGGQPFVPIAPHPGVQRAPSLDPSAFTLLYGMLHALAHSGEATAPAASEAMLDLDGRLRSAWEACWPALPAETRAQIRVGVSIAPLDAEAIEPALRFLDGIGV